MNKKTIIIIALNAVILLLVIGGYLLWKSYSSFQTPDPENEPITETEPTSNTQNPNNQENQNPVVDDYPVGATPNTQEEDGMTIRSKSGASIAVNNFYANPLTQILSPQKDAVIKNDPSYRIIYYTIDDSFFISLGKGDLKAIRTKGEEELLKILGISATEACQLRVSVTVPANVSMIASGIDYGLSYCPNGKPLPKNY